MQEDTPSPPILLTEPVYNHIEWYDVAEDHWAGLDSSTDDIFDWYETEADTEHVQNGGLTHTLYCADIVQNHGRPPRMQPTRIALKVVLNGASVVFFSIRFAVCFFVCAQRSGSKKLVLRSTSMSPVAVVARKIELVP